MTFFFCVGDWWNVLDVRFFPLFVWRGLLIHAPILAATFGSRLKWGAVGRCLRVGEMAGGGVGLHWYSEVSGRGGADEL